MGEYDLLLAGLFYPNPDIEIHFSDVAAGEQQISTIYSETFAAS